MTEFFWLSSFVLSCYVRAWLYDHNDWVKGKDTKREFKYEERSLLFNYLKFI